MAMKMVMIGAFMEVQLPKDWLKTHDFCLEKVLSINITIVELSGFTLQTNMACWKIPHFQEENIDSFMVDLSLSC